MTETAVPQAKSMSQIYEEETAQSEQSKQQTRQSLQQATQTVMRPLHAIMGATVLGGATAAHASGIYVPKNLGSILKAVAPSTESAVKPKMLRYTDSQLNNMSDYAAENVISNNMMQPDSAYTGDFIKSRSFSKDSGESTDEDLSFGRQPMEARVTAKVLPEKPALAYMDTFVPSETTEEDFGFVTDDSMLSDMTNNPTSGVSNGDFEPDQVSPETGDVYNRLARFGDPSLTIKAPELDTESEMGFGKYF